MASGRRCSSRMFPASPPAFSAISIFRLKTRHSFAEGFQRHGIKVVAIISRQHSEASSSQHANGRKLQDFADLVLDTGAPAGDAMVRVPNLDTPVAPGSTVGGCILINAIKAEVAARLTAAGQPPRVLAGSAVVGKARATELFESAYDEHARRLARLYATLGS
jgi:uncharacterized phosphosugar-binding protein